MQISPLYATVIAASMLFLALSSNVSETPCAPADQPAVCDRLCGLDAVPSAEHHFQGADVHQGKGDAQGEAAGHLCGEALFQEGHRPPDGPINSFQVDFLLRGISGM